MKKLMFLLVMALFFSGQAQIIVNPPAANLVTCDDDNDGFYSFDLTMQDEVITLGDPTLMVTYHGTLLDAENGVLPLPNLYINDRRYLDFPNTDTTAPNYGTGGVWARVENSTSNVINIVPFALEVRATPIGNTPAPLHKCDDAVPDGITFFDLTVVEAEVLGSLNQNGFDLYYYENLADAVIAGDLAATNPDFSQAISNPTSFLNSTNPQVIYILLVSNANGTIPPNPNSAEGCYDILELTIIVDSTPQDYGPFEMMLCDDEINGSTPFDEISTFDLTQNNAEITGGDPALIVSWYQTYADEQNDNPILIPQAYQNLATPQTVIYRVATPEGCKILGTLTLTVLPNPIPNQNPTPLEACDDNNDGIYSGWDLTEADIDIINGQTNVNILYYQTIAEAQAGIPGTEISMPFINTTPFIQTVFARVTNNVPPNILECYTIVELQLNINEIPPITQPNNIFIFEGDGDGFAIFDLTVNIPVMLGGLNPSDYVVTFYITEADAQNDINRIVNTTTYQNVVNPQIIYVRVENISTACFVITSFEIATDDFSPDADGDGIANEDEDINGNGNLNDDDTDGDGIPNYLDSDDDGDTVQTIVETAGIGAGIAPSYIYIDTDNDTIENYLDNDDDGDSTLTINEDYNNNGTPLDDDTNANGIPDFLDDAVFLSVNSFTFEDLSIYPNPTSQSFTVQSSQLILETTISIYDIQGKMLFSEKMLPQNGTLTMDVSSFENGVYFVKIASEGNSVVKKIIKN